MCFRPAEAGGNEPITCTNCGKQINRVAGELPSKCPFCKTSTEGMEDAAGAAAASAAPAAPGAPAAPAAPGAPKPPTA